ncbi:hypothetical protein TNCV_5039681 [Trichonephila clavipes]|nr:hypothetical protein TNCV_5039681 [Trichonephila clavipes]
MALYRSPLTVTLWPSSFLKKYGPMIFHQPIKRIKHHSTSVIADIRPQMLEKVIENWTSRLDYIRASRGSHMPEIIFKM